jgi:NADH dehydrogenase FAD-containing subunit
MGPGMLGRTYSPDDIRFATRQVVEKKGGRFLKAKVERIDPASRTVYTDSNDTVSYDLLSFNAGSYVSSPPVTGDETDIFPVKPIEQLMVAQERLLQLMSEKTIMVGIVGGGPSSAEIAGNVWALGKDHRLNLPTIHIFSGGPFMSRFPEGVRRRVLRSLTRRNVKIHSDAYVEKVENKRITTTSGDQYEADFLFLASGVTPSSIFNASGLPTGPDGGLLVNKYLQSTEYPDLFGGGDCIYFKDRPLDKVGVYAVRENPVLYHNLMAHLDGEPLMPFDPGGDYLLIFNLGGGEGVLQKRRLTFGGRLAFVIKDYIDMKFMRKFQSIE